MTLGERIRQEREQRGMSQAELARRIGVSKNTMNMIEESKIADPRFSRVLAVARQLGMSLDTLCAPPALLPQKPPVGEEGTKGICMTASGSEGKHKIAGPSEAIRSVTGAGGVYRCA